MVELPAACRHNDPSLAWAAKVRTYVSGNMVDNHNTGSKVMALGQRDYEVFRGDPAALPEEMAEVYGTIRPTPDVLRVAKFQQQVIGCYAMHSPQSPHADGKPMPFELCMVMVLDAYQRNGVGRWLVGHAIGVAESKGGRELRVPLPGPAEFFEGLGLRQVPGGFHYAMYPE